MGLLDNLFGGKAGTDPEPEREKRRLEYTLVKNTVDELLQKMLEHAPSVEQHSLRVSNTVKEMLQGKRGLKQETVERAYLTALLHDIGKLELPSDVAGLPDTVGFDNAGVYMNHSERGAEIVRAAAQKCPPIERYVSIEGIVSHHERADGTGYPHKLKASETAFEAKLIQVADAFDHLIFDPSESKMNMVEALNFMGEQSDLSGIYDPAIMVLLADHVSRSVVDAERADIGGATYAVEVGLNQYVRNTRKILKENLEINRKFRSLEIASASEKYTVLNDLARMLESVLPIPKRCGLNVLRHITRMPLAPDIKREDILLDKESYKALIEHYQEQLRSAAAQGAGQRHHLEMVLPIKNMSELGNLPIIVYAPINQLELWYCVKVDEETVLLLR